MIIKIIKLKRKTFFVLLGLSTTFVLSGKNENVQKLDKSETSWAWNNMSPESRCVIAISFFLFYWFYWSPEKKALYELKRELRELKDKNLPPLKIEQKIQENINEIQQNLEKYDQAVKEDNQQEIVKTGLLLKDLKEDLDDLNDISNIQKKEHTATIQRSFDKIPPINNKPLVRKEEKLPLFEQFDKVMVDLENRKIIERQGGDLKAHKKNKIVLYNDEYEFRRRALYNKKNNINDIRTNALLDTIERNQKKAKKKAEKIQFFEQIILKKEKQPLKNKKEIEASKKKIEMHNRQIDELIRLDLKDNLPKKQWIEIKELYPDPRQKEPKARKNVEGEIKNFNQKIKKKRKRPVNYHTCLFAYISNLNQYIIERRERGNSYFFFRKRVKRTDNHSTLWFSDFLKKISIFRDNDDNIITDYKKIYELNKRNTAWGKNWRKNFREITYFLENSSWYWYKYHKIKIKTPRLNSRTYWSRQYLYIKLGQTAKTAQKGYRFTHNVSYNLGLTEDWIEVYRNWSYACYEVIRMTQKCMRDINQWTIEESTAISPEIAKNIISFSTEKLPSYHTLYPMRMKKQTRQYKINTSN